jgi:hypothetical protein
MCFGVGEVIGLALSAATSIASFSAKQEAANEQTARYNQNVTNSLAAARDQHNQLTLRTMQEAEASQQKEYVHNVEAAERAADVSVSAAGGNVGGLSVDALIGDITRKSALNRSTVQRNYQMTAAQLQQQQIGVVTQAESRINSMAPGSPPSPIGPALEIAGAGIKAYGNFEARRGA